MKFLLLLLVLGAGGFFGYPLFNENVADECDAVERLVMRTVVSPQNRPPQAQDMLLGQFLQGLSKGQIANMAAKSDYPKVPITAACALVYWRAFGDPQGFRKDIGLLR